MMRDFFKGFLYAGRGLKNALLEERNLRFHFCVAAYVLLFSFFYSFGVVEYCVILLIIAAVISMELLNSAIERAVDLTTRDKNSLAAKAKDMAAAAVLILCVAAVAIGVLLFWEPAVFMRIFLFFIQYPLLFVLFLLSLAASFWFVFICDANNKV